jgi:hyperosmotically inducible protein
MPMRTDGEIQQDVMDELTWDAAVDARHLGATVVAGMVRITGQVSAYAQKREAERLAEMIPGVRAVIVHIDVVTVPAVGDAELGAAVHNALNWVASLSKDAVAARVEGGWVTLSGVVNSAFQRHMAEDAICNMKGVTGLDNAIIIRNRQMPVRDIKASLEAALTRRYDTANQDVLVTVDDRVVTLSGTVADWWHRHRTRQAAWKTAGVEDVRDHIRIAD